MPNLDSAHLPVNSLAFTVSVCFITWKPVVILEQQELGGDTT